MSSGNQKTVDKRIKALRALLREGKRSPEIVAEFLQRIIDDPHLEGYNSQSYGRCRIGSGPILPHQIIAELGIPIIVWGNNNEVKYYAERPIEEFLKEYCKDSGKFEHFLDDDPKDEALFHTCCWLLMKHGQNLIRLSHHGFHIIIEPSYCTKGILDFYPLLSGKELLGGEHGFDLSCTDTRGARAKFFVSATPEGRYPAFPLPRSSTSSEYNLLLERKYEGFRRAGLAEVLTTVTTWQVIAEKLPTLYLPNGKGSHEASHNFPSAGKSFKVDTGGFAGKPFTVCYNGPDKFPPEEVGISIIPRDKKEPSPNYLLFISEY